METLRTDLEYLTPWTKPNDYMGEDLTGWYHTPLLRTYLSGVDLVKTANCKAFINKYGEWAEEFHFGHWATPFYAIFVKGDTPNHVLENMDEDLREIEEVYPLMDEEIYYHLETEAREWSIETFIDDLEADYGITLDEYEVDMVWNWYSDCGELCEDYYYMNDEDTDRLKSLILERHGITLDDEGVA